MRKVWLLLAALLFGAAGPALGAEFQPMGTLGIGGAGVARTYDSHAPYWNPAGLAFSTNAFSSRTDVSLGLKVNDGLADNVDRLSDLDFDTFNEINVGGAANPGAVTDTIKTITILNDIKTKNGTLSVNGNAVFGFQIKRIAFGAFGTFEGFAQPLPDTVNILPENDDTGIPVNRTEFANQVAGSPLSTQFFGPVGSPLRTSITDALTTTGGFSLNQANDIINATDAQLATSGLSSEEVANTLISSLAPAFGSPDSRILDKNTTAVQTKSLAYVEFPLSYGHPIGLGSLGTLGIGATAKIIAGRVYNAQTFLLKEDTTVESNDIVKELTRSFKDTVNFGFDLGALWRYSDWLNVGVVAKNLNAPEFDAPDLKDKSGIVIPNSGGKVKLKPQARLGVSLDPVQWLTLAADLDLTENETVVEADNFKSRHIGGGFEWHSLSWFKLRGGMYSNLAKGGIGPTATAGLTFGTKWINVDLDAAYGLDTAQFEEKTYPQEVRVQFQANFLF